jgi:flagellar biosynthetic protein FliQ
VDIALIATIALPFLGATMSAYMNRIVDMIIVGG